MSNDVINCPECDDGLLQYKTGQYGWQFYCDRCHYHTDEDMTMYSESRIENERYQKRITLKRM